MTFLSQKMKFLNGNCGLIGNLRWKMVSLVLGMSRKAGNFFKLSLSKQAQGIPLLLVTGEVWKVCLYLSRWLFYCEVLLGLYLFFCERNSELTLPVFPVVTFALVLSLLLFLSCAAWIIPCSSPLGSHVCHFIGLWGDRNLNNNMNTN